MDETKCRKCVTELAEDPVEASKPDFLLKRMGLMTKAKHPSEEQKMTAYLKHCKKVTATRMLSLIFHPESGPLDAPFWISLSRKPFLGQKFSEKRYMA